MSDDLTIPQGQMAEFNYKQDYNISFHSGGKIVGRLDFNGPALKFEGEAEESAKVFIERLTKCFAGRLAKERERCAKVAEEAWMPQLIHYPEDQYSVNPNRIGEIRKQQVDLCVKAIRGMKDE